MENQEKSPTLGDINEEWSRVKPRLEQLCIDNPQDWTPLDVKRECTEGCGIFFCNDEGFVVVKIYTSEYTGEKTFFIWIACAYELGHEYVKKHLPFFDFIANKMGCKWIETASPVDALEPYLVDCGFTVRTRFFARQVNEFET